jgi:hypothetical protein
MFGCRPELIEPLMALHAALGTGISLIDKGPAGPLLSTYGHIRDNQYNG